MSVVKILRKQIQNPDDETVCIVMGFKSFQSTETKGFTVLKRTNETYCAIDLFSDLSIDMETQGWQPLFSKLVPAGECLREALDESIGY